MFTDQHLCLSRRLRDRHLNLPSKTFDTNMLKKHHQQKKTRHPFDLNQNQNFNFFFHILEHLIISIINVKKILHLLRPSLVTPLHVAMQS